MRFHAAAVKFVLSSPGQGDMAQHLKGTMD